MSIGVRIDGSSLNMNGAADSDGDRFVISDIEGMDGIDGDLTLTNHHRDGSAYSRGRYPKRELNIKGIAWAPGATDYGALRVRQKIENMFADYLWQERYLYVDMPAPGKNVMFKTRPGGKIHFDAPVGNSQTFEVPLTCADPRKYDQALQAGTLSGSTVLTNFGNFPTYLYAALSSNATDPYLQNDTLGQRITLSGSIPSGTIVDFYARRTIVSGTFQEVALRPRIWWYLAPGNNTISTNASWNFSFHGASR